MIFIYGKTQTLINSYPIITITRLAVTKNMNSDWSLLIIQKDRNNMFVFDYIKWWTKGKLVPYEVKMDS